MKRLGLLLSLILSISSVNAQITNTTLTLTAAYDQIRFTPSGYSRYFFMSKPVSSIAFGQYSPEDGGWFTYWKTGSGDMIVNKGNVGVGTSTPGAKLEVKSSGAVYTGNPSLLVKDATNRGTLFLESVTDKPADFVFKNNNRLSWVISTRGASEDYALRFFPSVNGTSWYTPTLTLLTSGKVGIGTTTPSSQLHATGTIRAGNFRFNSNGHIIDDARYDNYILSWDWNSTYGDHTKINWGGNGAGTDLIISQNKGLIWDGKFTTEEVSVEVIGADFVFAPDYNLMPLAQIETYIKENHHLPEVPSAAEMQANGVELGKMNMLLLQKIEELTLHQIEMSKLLIKQQKEIIKLKNSIK